MEAASATRQASTEAHIKDQQEMFSDCQARVREVLEQQKRVMGEDTQNRERWVEMQAMLERSLHEQRRLRDEEGRRFAELLGAEKRSSEQILNDFQQQRDSTADSLKRIHDESRNRLAG